MALPTAVILALLSLEAGGEEPPVWPGGASCTPKRSTLDFEAFRTTPREIDKRELRKGGIPNSCTQICLPVKFRRPASKRGVMFGSTCFGNSSGVDAQVDVHGKPIPPGTPICPGFTFARSGKQAGVEFFKYTCEVGEVIDFAEYDE